MKEKLQQKLPWEYLHLGILETENVRLQKQKVHIENKILDKRMGEITPNRYVNKKVHLKHFEEHCGYKRLRCRYNNNRLPIFPEVTIEKAREVLKPIKEPKVRRPLYSPPNRSQTQQQVSTSEQSYLGELKFTKPIKPISPKFKKVPSRKNQVVDRKECVSRGRKIVKLAQERMSRRKERELKKRFQEEAKVLISNLVKKVVRKVFGPRTPRVIKETEQSKRRSVAATRLPALPQLAQSPKAGKTKKKIDLEEEKVESRSRRSLCGKAATPRFKPVVKPKQVEKQVKDENQIQKEETEKMQQEDQNVSQIKQEKTAKVLKVEEVVVQIDQLDSSRGSSSNERPQDLPTVESQISTAATPSSCLKKPSTIKKEIVETKEEDEKVVEEIKKPISCLKSSSKSPPRSPPRTSLIPPDSILKPANVVKPILKSALRSGSQQKEGVSVRISQEIDDIIEKEYVDVEQTEQKVQKTVVKPKKSALKSAFKSKQLVEEEQTPEQEEVVEAQKPKVRMQPKKSALKGSRPVDVITPEESEEQHFATSSQQPPVDEQIPPQPTKSSLKTSKKHQKLKEKIKNQKPKSILATSKNESEEEDDNLYTVRKPSQAPSCFASKRRASLEFSTQTNGVLKRKSIVGTSCATSQVSRASSLRSSPNSSRRQTTSSFSGGLSALSSRRVTTSTVFSGFKSGSSVTPPLQREEQIVQFEEQEFLEKVEEEKCLQESVQQQVDNQENQRVENENQEQRISGDSFGSGRVSSYKERVSGDLAIETDLWSNSTPVVQRKNNLSKLQARGYDVPISNVTSQNVTPAKVSEKSSPNESKKDSPESQKVVERNNFKLTKIMPAGTSSSYEQFDNDKLFKNFSSGADASDEMSASDVEKLKNRTPRLHRSFPGSPAPVIGELI